jgi:uncharacterized membrane protein YkoI
MHMTTIVTITALLSIGGTAAAAAQQPAATDTAHKATYTREVPDSLLAQAKVGEDSARTLALSHAGGGTVQALELEREDGKLIWSFDIKVPGKAGITEVNVSALDGSLVGLEHESN